MADLDPVASVLKRGPMPLSQSAKIVGKICGLLAPLHDRRKSHGAIAPENVWFRHVGGELTVELKHSAVPSALYATPERASGRPEGPSADVYALGTLLYHMITGGPPFDGDTEDEVLEKHLQSGVPPLGFNELQDIPMELEALVRAMMAKDPVRRPIVRKIAEDIDNLDLDSTVMGVRLQAVLEGERTETPDLEARLIQNVRIELEGPRTDPNLVDPYADTLIKNRSDLGLDEFGAQDTHLSIQVVPKPAVPTSGWNDDPTRILVDHRDHMHQVVEVGEPTEPEPPADSTPPSIGEGEKSSRLLFVAGLIFFLVALTAAIIVASR